MEVNYVYCLVDPITMERRYIGKAKNVAERLRKHLLPYYLKADTYKNRWLRKLKTQGLKPLVVVLSEVHPKTDEINDVERFWIRIFRQAGHRLTNGTDGGDGGRTRPPKIKPAKSVRPFPWFDACTANSRTWRVISPLGQIYVIVNLRDFCIKYGLNASKMYAVAKGANNRKQHKGWRCEEVK